MTNDVNSPLPLRERKRRDTHTTIADHATRLALERGLDVVTVDDICQAAEISRRTFFNYVDSKEFAVFGAPPRELDEKEAAEFCATEHSHLIQALILLASRLADPHLNREDPRAGDIVRRRKKLSKQHPQRSAQQIAQFNSLRSNMITLLLRYFAAWPKARALPEETAETEALALVSIMSSAMMLGSHNWAHSENSTLDALLDHCFHAVECITGVLEKK